MHSTLDALIASADRGDRAAADALFERSTRSSIGWRAASWRGRPRRRPRRDDAAARGLLRCRAREGTVFPDRARFMAYAARVMRGLIIDDVRRRQAQKRGGWFDITALDTDIAGQRRPTRRSWRASATPSTSWPSVDPPWPRSSI